MCGNCSDGETCHNINGTCLHGCTEGTIGDTCQEGVNNRRYSNSSIFEPILLRHTVTKFVRAKLLQGADQDNVSGFLNLDNLNHLTVCVLMKINLTL